MGLSSNMVNPNLGFLAGFFLTGVKILELFNFGILIGELVLKGEFFFSLRGVLEMLWFLLGDNTRLVGEDMMKDLVLIMKRGDGKNKASKDNASFIFNPFLFLNFKASPFCKVN